jgi:hypothetical protein
MDFKREYSIDYSRKTAQGWLNGTHKNKGNHHADLSRPLCSQNRLSV